MIAAVRRLRPLLLLALLLAVPAAAQAQGKLKGLALAPGDQAPELRGTTPNDERIRVLYDTEKLTLINFWAPWCEPCKDEMPALQALSDRTEGIQIIGVIQDDAAAEDMQAFLDDLEVSYPNVYPWERAFDQWGEIRVLPTSFLIDAEGKILRRYLGSSPPQVEGLLFDVESYLAGNGLGPYVYPE